MDELITDVGDLPFGLYDIDGCESTDFDFRLVLIEFDLSPFH